MLTFSFMENKSWKGISPQNVFCFAWCCIDAATEVVVVVMSVKIYDKVTALSICIDYII